jgi:multiple sugar transport system substrate-binding protein
MRKTNPGFYGFVWQGAQYEGLICDFMEFSGSNGGFILQDGKICINNPRNQAALAYMHDLIWKHRVSPPSTYTEMKEEETRMYFQSGNALFERNWPYAWSLHQRPGSLVRGKIKIAPLPAPPKGQSVSTLGGWHIGLSRFSDCKSRAVRLIQFVTAYETQKKLALRLGWNPGRKDLYNDPDILSQAPHFRELKEVFDLARPRPLLPYYPQVSAITQRHLNAALAGRQSPESALADAQQEISALQGRFQ